MSSKNSTVRRIATAALSLACAAGVGVVAGTTATVAGTPMAAHAASSVGGQITRSEIIARAQYWVDKGYTYDGTSSAPDQQGKNYRKDCSGLVSMAWHLTAAEDTSSFPGSGLWTALGSLNDLKPGDTIHHTGHMELFSNWKDEDDHTKGAYVYSFNNTGESVQNPYAENNVGKLGFNSWSDMNDYDPYRYKNVIDDTVSNAPRKAAPALAYSVADTSMKIYRWTSDGTAFNRTTDYESGTFPLSNVGDRMASGDVNGDGKDDVVMAYQLADGTFSYYVWYSGTGSAKVFWTSGSFSLSKVGGRLVLGDFDGDGKAEPEMAYDNGDGTMTLYRWTSTGTSFARTTDYRSGSFSLAAVGDRMAAGDVDGDGKDDVVMAYQKSDGTFAYYVWSGGLASAKVFWSSGSFNLDNVAGRLVVGDLDGDGKAEPAVTYDQGDGTMRIYRWKSTGDTFARAADYESGTFSLAAVGDRVAVADVNADGKEDIVMAYQKSDGTFAYYAWTNGTGSPKVLYTSGTFSLGAVGGRLVLGVW